jgi:GGDEF domain-containing protein
VSELISDVAAITAERDRQRIESHTYPQVGNVALRIGYSAARGTDAATAVFEHADAALYYAKQHGRNQSHCYKVLTQSGELKDKDASGEIELF